MLVFIRRFEGMISFMCFNTIHHILSIPTIHIIFSTAGSGALRSGHIKLISRDWSRIELCKSC